MAYGVTSTGFVAKTLADIVDEIKADVLATTPFGAGANVDEDSVFGALIQIMAKPLAEEWEALEAVYNALNPATAEGADQDNSYSLVGCARLAETYSTVVYTATGTPGTVITGGSSVRASSTGGRFESLAGATIGMAGTVDIDMIATEAGAVGAPAGTIDTIETPIAGWTGGTNAEDADVGRAEESDSEYRIRRERSVQIAGGGTLGALWAKLLTLDGVDDVHVVENTGDTTDGDGRPPHSVECIVDGGEDQEIADLIWENRGGVRPYGLQTETVLDYSGASQSVEFTRPADVDVYMHVEVEVDDLFNQGQQQVNRVTVAQVLNLTAYTVTINGTAFIYTSDATATDLEIAAGLVSAINTGTYVPVTASDNGDGTFDLTADFAGNSFTLTVTATKLTSTQITANGGSQGDIREAILDWAEDNQGIGDDVILSRYYTPVNQVGHINGITIKAGLSAQPTGTANLSISLRECAVLDSGRVTVEVV